jgi:erythromycin esterase-like protein
MAMAWSVGEYICAYRRLSAANLICATLLALFLSAAAWGALPGVTELAGPPEKLTDTELATLLRSRIAGADVIAIGESVHGSSGFLRMQTRLIQHLVSQHGIRLIAWETAVLRGFDLTRWLSECTTTRAPVPFGALYGPTASDLPLWEWACGYNRANPRDPLVFSGMDVWDRPWEHYARIEALGISAGVAPRLVADMHSCPARRAASWHDVRLIYARLAQDRRFLPVAEYARCRAALTAIVDGARQAGAAKRRSDARAAEAAYDAALSASTLLGWLGYYDRLYADDMESWNERDRAQGRNLMILMEKHGAARAIVAAHTSHVSHNRSPADWWGYGDLKSGVHFFSALTGKRVFNIALTAYYASGNQGEWMLPGSRNSMDKKLYDAGHVFSLFFSDAAFLSEHPRWWMQNGNNAEKFENGVEIVPKDHFDAFVFFSESLLDKELPAPDTWEP